MQLGAQATVSVQTAAQGPLVACLIRGDIKRARLEVRSVRVGRSCVRESGQLWVRQVFDAALSSEFALYEYYLYPSSCMVQLTGSFLFVVSSESRRGTHPAP